MMIRGEVGVINLKKVRAIERHQGSCVGVLCRYQVKSIEHHARSETPIRASLERFVVASGLQGTDFEHASNSQDNL